MISILSDVTYGRLGNKLLQNVGVSVLSKKYDFFAKYNEIQENHILNLNLNSGSIVHQDCKIYTDLELEYLLDSQTKLENGIIYNGYFQFKCLLLDNKKLVESVVPKIEITQKNKVFVHVRLGDVENVNYGLNYYEEILNNISFSDGMVSSDSPDHHIVQTLAKKYDLQILNCSPIDTLLIASQYEHRVLSGGTFSWWIGFLGNNNNVYCRRKPMFHGDIFVYPEWKYYDL